MNAVMDYKPKNSNTQTLKINRKEIWMVELRGGSIGSEQSGLRPFLITQNFMGNLHAPTTIGFPISTAVTKAKLPTHVQLFSHNTGLQSDSVCLTEQIRTVDKGRLMYKVGEVDENTMYQIDRANMISQGLEYLLAR